LVVTEVVSSLALLVPELSEVVIERWFGLVMVEAKSYRGLVQKRT
jgi:hypothetical protein